MVTIRPLPKLEPTSSRPTRKPMRNVANQPHTFSYSKGSESEETHNTPNIRKIKSDWTVGKQSPSPATANKKALRRRDTLADLRATSNDKNDNSEPRWNGHLGKGNLSASLSVAKCSTSNTTSSARVSTRAQSAKAESGASFQGTQARRIREEPPARRSGDAPRISYVKPDRHQVSRSDTPATRAASLCEPQHVPAMEFGRLSESEVKPHDSVSKPPTKDESAKLRAFDETSRIDNWDPVKSPRSTCNKNVGHERSYEHSQYAVHEHIRGLDMGLKTPADFTKTLRLSYYANPRQVWWRPSVSAEVPHPEHIEIVTTWLGLTPSIATTLFSIHSTFLECLQNILSPQLRKLCNDARAEQRGKIWGLHVALSAANTQRILRFSPIELSTAMIDHLILHGALGDRDISMPHLVNLYLATLNHVYGDDGENDRGASIAVRVKNGEVTASQHTHVEALPMPDFLVFNEFNASPREGEQIVLQPSYRCTSPYRMSEAPATVIYKASAPWLQWDGATGCFRGVVHGVAQYSPGLCGGASEKPHHNSYPLRVTIEATYICHGPVAPVWVERSIRAHIQFYYRPWQAAIQSGVSLHQPDLSQPDIYLERILDTLVVAASGLAHDQTAQSKGGNHEQEHSVIPVVRDQLLRDTCHDVSLLGKKHGYLETRLSALAQEHAEARVRCADYCRTLRAMTAKKLQSENPNEILDAPKFTKAHSGIPSSCRSTNGALTENGEWEKANPNSKGEDDPDTQRQYLVKQRSEIMGNSSRPANPRFIVRHRRTRGSEAFSTETSAEDEGRTHQVTCHNRPALLSDSACELSSQYENEDVQYSSTDKESYEGDTAMDDSQSDVGWSAYSSCDDVPLLGATSMTSSSTAEYKSRINRETLSHHRRAVEIDQLTALSTPKSLQPSNKSAPNDLNDKERMSPEEKLDLDQAIKDSIEEQTRRKMAELGLPEHMDDIFDDGSSTDENVDTDADATATSMDEEA